MADRRWIRFSRIWGAWSLICWGEFALGCGARTDLRGAARCSVEGEVQACARGCAEGTTVCTEGFWSDCATQAQSRSCDNDCGTGTQECVDEHWGPCVVAPVTASCDNTCGSGTQSCVDGIWSACEVAPVVEACSFGCGDGERSCVDDSWSECDAPMAEATVIKATVRDFRSSHPDMERRDWGGLELGIVERTLGSDGKPVYTGGADGTETTSGADAFYQWYHDSEVTQKTTIDLLLTKMHGRIDWASEVRDFYEYNGRNFFPIDDELLGNEGNFHNFHFTLEAHEEFIYQRGQEFTFEGDDDMWVFINSQLAIDLGGTHQTESQTVRLSKLEEELGLEQGKSYPLDIFFAERHTLASNFVIRTSIAGLGQCPE